MVPKIRGGQILFWNKPNQRSLVRNCEHYLNLETIMTEDTTTSEQLAEIEGQPQPVQVREGRWKTRDGEVRNVTPTPEGDGLAERWPWWDAADRHFWRANGRYYFDGKGPLDLVAYLGPIEPEPEPQPQPERQATQYTPPEGWRLVETHEELDIPGRDQYVRGPNRYIRPIDPQPQPQPADTADELRSEIHYLQRELAVAKEELKIAAAVSQQLQIELDAAQQVPVDSLDLQQLRLRLADMTLDRDTYKDAYDRIFADLFTIKETTKAETVEAITEWLQHFRGCNSPSLALLLLEALPRIMRSLTGLNPEEIE
jgi:hypothetical protein